MQNEGNVEGKSNVRSPFGKSVMYGLRVGTENLWKAGCEWQLTDVTYRLVGCASRTAGRLTT